jgi:hypothetical protein
MSTAQTTWRPHQLLPAEAVALLQRAAATPDAHQKRLAVDRAIDKVRRLFPENFRQE